MAWDLDGDSDDHRLLKEAGFIYDALSAWCRRDVRTGGGA